MFFRNIIEPGPGLGLISLYIMYYMYQMDDYDDNIMTNGCLSKPDRSTSHKYAPTETSYNNMTMFTTQSHIMMNDNNNDIAV